MRRRGIKPWMVRLLAVAGWGMAVAAGSVTGCDDGESNPGPPPVSVLDAVITFRVRVPPATPDSARIWISGNHPALGDWNGRGLAARRVGVDLYEAVQTFNTGTPLEFKVTRGNWETVEKHADGSERPNRIHTVTGPDTLDVVVANWRDWVEKPPPSTLTGDIRLHRAFPSAFLPRARDVIVYLPPGYADQPERRYPVLYMHDGQNLFDRATSFIGIEWEVDETAQRLIEAGEIEPLIVVGAYNTPDRVAEYTPAVEPGRGGGNADNYGRFLVEELKPFIDRTYRTRPGRADTGVAGSSLGGLVSMYFALTRAETFSRIGVISPAVWWAGRDLVARVLAHDKTDCRIWEDIGTGEGTQAVEGARALRDALLQKGWTVGGDFLYREDPGAPHHEGAWAARMGDILRFLYPAP